VLGSSITIDQVADALRGSSPAIKMAMMLPRRDVDICWLGESEAVPMCRP